MKNYIKSIFIVAILLLIQVVWTFSSAEKINPLELPKFHYFINDYSQILDQNSRNTLNQQAKSIQDSYGPQVVTVLFPHREGNELFDIAIKAFNKNWIWDKKKNDGLLLAIATQEKKIRIMVGYGLESKIPDILANKIIEKHIRPQVNQGNFSQAIKNFYTQVETILWGNYKESKKNNIQKYSFNLLWIDGIILFWIIIWIFYWVNKKTKILSEKHIHTIWRILFALWINIHLLNFARWIYSIRWAIRWTILIILWFKLFSLWRKLTFSRLKGWWRWGSWWSSWWWGGFSWWGGSSWWGGGFSWWGGSSWWGGAGD